MQLYARVHELQRCTTTIKRYEEPGKPVARHRFASHDWYRCLVPPLTPTFCCWFSSPSRSVMSTFLVPSRYIHKHVDTCCQYPNTRSQKTFYENWVTHAKYALCPVSFIYKTKEATQRPNYERLELLNVKSSPFFHTFQIHDRVTADHQKSNRWISWLDMDTKKKLSDWQRQITFFKSIT